MLIKTTALEYVLLGFATLDAFSGYDIKKIFDKSYIIRWSASPGSIYPALKRLEEKGYLKSKKVNTGKLPKDIYYVTDKGMKLLKEWLLKPFKGTEIVRYGLELKILFLHNLSDEERKIYIQRQIEEVEKSIDELPYWKRRLSIKNKYRDLLYEEKLREFKNYIRVLENLLDE